MKNLLLIILLFSTTLFANIGKISALSGDVSITRNSQNIPATIGFTLEEKDKISTTDNARVQLLFNDKTVISLGKNSTFNIEEYFYDIQKPTETKASFKMAHGILKTITGQIGKVNPNKFTLKTRSASIGIRGTTFFIDSSSQTQDQSNPQERIVCSGGIIEVITPQGTQLVRANQFITVRLNQAPSTPQDVPATQMNSMQQNSGASENEQESGYDENIFFESNTPVNEIPNTETPTLENNNPTDLAQNILNDNVDTDKFDDTLSDFLDISILYVDFSSSFTIYTGDFNANYEFITNDLLTSVLGNGVIMKINDGTIDGFEWGLWSSSGVSGGDYLAEKAWITGQNIVSDLSSLTSANNATYMGTLIGYDYSNGAYINPLSSTITLDFDFGANTTFVDLVVNGGGTSDISFTGTYSSSGSTYSIIDGQNLANQLTGSFFDNMNITAGAVETDNIAAGYIATKTSQLP